ncbi:MAG: hypothetical protein ACR2GU_13360 [Rubrobacteraceae bacterium]
MRVSWRIFLRRIVLLGTPLALTILMLFHPSPYDDVIGALIPMAGWWLTLHVVQFVLFALMGAAVYLLVDGLKGVAATISRLAAAVFVIFYDAGDAVAGIATGILAQSAQGLPVERQTALAESIRVIFGDPTKNLLFEVGILAWVIALVTVAISLYRAGASRLPLILLILPALFMNLDHAFPFGSLTFGTFLLIALWLEIDRFPLPRKGIPRSHED